MLGRNVASFRKPALKGGRGWRAVMDVAERAAGEGFMPVLILINDEASAGACVLHFREGNRPRFETIGRDEAGGFLVADDGEVFRLVADAGELDTLLLQDRIHIDELDENGVFVGSYPVAPSPYGSAPGFRG